MSSAILAALLLAASAPDPTAQAPLKLELLLGPNFGMELGIRDVHSARQLLFLYDGELSRRVGFDESTAFRRVAGIFGRTAKLVLVDAPITSFLDTFEHEVFGHGARSRENGLSPTFEFAVPFPYVYLLAPNSTFAGNASYTELGSPDRDLPMVEAGIEANLYSAHFTALRTFRDGGRIHYSESLHYLESSLAYATRWVDGQKLGERLDGSDVDYYLVRLQQRFNRYGDKSALELAQRLRRGWAVSFLDPMFWISAYDVVVNFLGKGQRYSEVPQLSLGGVRLFPMTRFLLTPFGGEQTVDVMISTDRFTLDVSARAASSGLADAYGIGARLFRFELSPMVQLGASMDLWVQPELLPEYRNAFDGRTLPGVSAMLEAVWRPIPSFGVVAQLGGKSRGYVFGQPLDGGAFGFAGVAWYEAP